MPQADPHRARASTIDERIARGIAQNGTDGGAIVPFPDDGVFDLSTCLQPSDAKAEIFRLINDGWAETLFRYRSSVGAVILIVLRLDHPAKAARKFVRPMRVKRIIGIRPDIRIASVDPLRPLYGLDRLAGRPEAEILLVEGEKAADAAQLLFPDHVAMTWPNGTAGIKQADFRAVAERQVRIWPDNDQAGAGACRPLCLALALAGAAAVRVVRIPPSFPPKWDLADPLPSNGNE